MPYADVIQHTLGDRPIEAYSHDNKKLVSPKYSGYANGFIAAAHAAYARHYPLVLSLDMIWLLIAQGFAIHVRENAEALRHRFVAHEGQASLTVVRPEFVRGFTGNDWEGVFSELSTQIRDRIGPASHDALVPSFSTTGIVEKAAFEATLLDAMQQYFNYDVVCICGIPSFHLEGTPDDWQRLRDTAATLTEYELDWWTPHLLKVLDEFVAASEGNPTPSFWQDFFRESSCESGPKTCGEPRFKGHIVNFFPYLEPKQPKPGTYGAQPGSGFFSEIHTRKNHLLGKRIHRSNVRNFVVWGRQQIDHYEPDEFSLGQGITNSYLPSGLSFAPFTWIGSKASYRMAFVAGFVGMTQDKMTKALRPEIGWAVREAV